jgi:hypothetical protein
MRRWSPLAAVALVIAVGAVGSAAAQSVAVNDTVAALALVDQHGQPGGVDATTRAVLLSRDMEGGGLVHEALATDGAAQLDQAGAVYIADVHAMPGPVRRFIASPRMRERPHRVLLDTDGAPSAALPREAGKATWLRLDGLSVLEIRFLRDFGRGEAGSGRRPLGELSGGGPALGR